MENAQQVSKRKEGKKDGGREEGEHIHTFLDNIFYSDYVLQ